MKAATKNWLGLADESYQDAEYLFKGARHPNAVYHYWQALEKILKAAQVELVAQVPKKIHNLVTLANQSGLKFSTEQLASLKELSKHYRRVRYRDLSQAHYNTKKKVQPIIKEVKTLYLWTSKKLTSL